MRLLAVTTAKRAAMARRRAGHGRNAAGLRRDRVVLAVRAGQDAQGHDPENVHRRETAVRVDDPTIRKRLEEQAMIVVGSTPEGLGRFTGRTGEVACIDQEGRT